MKKTPFIVDIRPVHSETLTAEDYLKVTTNSPGLIQKARFVPPGPGASHFGKFVVQYSRARHRVPAHG